MHSIAEIGTNIPAFLAKLWRMVEDPVTNELISWNPSGSSFVIKDENRFSRELLPMYYKHNNMASFIRQLNMYGFHKIVSDESGSMNLEKPDKIQFSHPFFVRGHSYLLDNIKRKMTGRMPSQVGEKTNPQVLGKVLMDVKQMKGRQESIDSRLTAMKMENGALWRELSVLRQKHMKQQQMVNKLIQFLVTLVHQNPNMFSMKRKYPRMLQQIVVHSKHKPGQVDDEASNQCVNSPTGPIIHELDPAEVLLEDVSVEAEDEEIDDEPVSPSQVSNYFMNESNEDIDDGVSELPFTVLENKKDVETIIGMPEDTLIMGSKKNKQNNLTNNLFYTTKGISKEQPVLIPKYNVNIVTSKANRDSDLQNRIFETQQRVMQNQQQTKQELQHQIQQNKQQIQRNQAQINRTKELKRNQQQILKNQLFVLKNQQQVLKSIQGKVKNDEQLTNKGQHIITNTVKLQGNQQQSKRIQQLQKNQQKILQKRQKPLLRKQQFSKGLCQQSQKSLLTEAQTIPYVEVKKSPYVEVQKSPCAEVQKSPYKVPNSPYVEIQKSPYVEVQRSSYVEVQTSPYVEVQKSPYVELQTSPYVEAQKSPDHQLQKSPHQQQKLQVSLKKEVREDKMQQKVQPESETISLDSRGSVETILGLVDGPGGEVCEYSGVAAPDFTVPIIVEVPHSDTLQNSPLVSQDLLIGSPAAVLSNPVPTPRSAVAASPVTSSPNPCSSNMQVACLDESQISSPNLMTRSATYFAEMGSHIDTMQSDLESLKELLQSEGISLDANTLLGCFNEDPLSYNMPDPVAVPSEDPNRPRENNGNELMAYNPSLLDLTDLMGNEWSPPTSPSGETLAADDSFGEMHTPQFVPNSPTFPLPAKRRKK